MTHWKTQVNDLLTFASAVGSSEALCQSLGVGKSKAPEIKSESSNEKYNILKVMLLSLRLRSLLSSSADDQDHTSALAIK